MADSDIPRGSRWVTMAEAIAIFGRSERTIRRWVEEGRIEARRERGRVLLLVHVGRTAGDRPGAAAPDRTESADITAAELAELRARLEEVSRQRDYLEQALAAALSKIPQLEARTGDPPAAGSPDTPTVRAQAQGDVDPGRPAARRRWWWPW